MGNVQFAQVLPEYSSKPAGIATAPYAEKSALAWWPTIRQVTTEVGREGGETSKSCKYIVAGCDGADGTASLKPKDIHQRPWMSFHPTRFPLDIALGARGGPERTTDIVTLASGREERNSRWAQSRRRYNAGYGVKSRADMQAVLAFFEERRGRFHSFLWRDGLDHSSGADTPTALDQAIGTGDGSTTAFQLSKTYGAAFDPYVRPITKPVDGSVKLAVDGVELASGGFTVNTLTGVVTVAEAPAEGAAVTAGFLFDVPVRFDTDRLDIELSSFDAADVPAIPLIEVLE